MNSAATSTPGDQRSARDFYDALHRAFDLTVRQGRGQTALIDALMSQSFDTFQGNVTIQCEDEPEIACRRGCAICCGLRVGATAPEIWLVARFLRAVAPQLAERGVDLVAGVRRADACCGGLGEAERMRSREPCAFVAQGVCVIYPVRPLACRGVASHDIKACVDAAAGRRDEAAFSVGHVIVRSIVQNVMQSSLREEGLAWGMYEFNRGLLIALDEPGAERAWLDGEDPLAPAALDAISANEMNEVFDQLRPRGAGA